jgi:hypothetical protein
MAQPIRTTQGHPVLELIHSQHKRAELVDRRLGQLDMARTSIQMVAGGRAFREYNALAGTIGLSNAKNLRGMVVSKNWRVLFRHSSEIGEYMENIGYLASIAAEISKSAPLFQKIVDSSDSSALKGMQIASLAGSIAQKVLVGAVPAGAHLIYRSLEGWCMLAGLAGSSVQPAATSCIDTLKHADTLVQTTFDTITDTSEQSKAVWYVIDIATTPRPGSGRKP